MRRCAQVLGDHIAERVLLVALDPPAFDFCISPDHVQELSRIEDIANYVVVDG